MTQALVAPTHCANCGRALAGAYCAACGQKAAPLDPTVRDVFHDVGQEIFNVDGKTLGSIRLLLTRPGFLTREHLEGRRIRYVSPLRLYLTFSVAFFLVSALLSTPLDEQDLADLEQASGLMGDMARANPNFAQTVDEWMPRTMFVLVPVFALLTAAVTRSNRRNYPQHLYFALHLHAGVFAFATAWMLLRFGRSEVMDVVADVTVLTAVTWYTVTAFKVAYGGTWRHAFGRAAAVGAMYLVAYSVMLAILVGSALYL